MPHATLSGTSYGKSRIRLVRVTRHGATGAQASSDSRHDLRDYTVAVAFDGRYDTSYTDGDNRDVLPTDTMKNTVYALAARDGVGEPEAFASALGRHFIERNPKLDRVHVEIVDHAWGRIIVGDREHGQAFVRRGPDTRTAHVTTDRTGSSITAGVSDLVIMKTSNSAFAGYPRDPYTTLPETRDRLFATSMTATWTYAATEVEYASTFLAVRTTLLEAFAEHHSESVQHTMYAMGQRVLDAIPVVRSISLEMPNRHHLPVNLEPFGMENRNEVFVATEEPYGLIKATVSR